jgi:diguanylate cyclase (GGDEF)-like protein
MVLNESKLNTAILCVDDEPGILEAYRNVLAAKEKVDSDIENMLSRRNRRKSGQNEKTTSTRKQLIYEVFTASSGEEAVEIAREQLAASRQIAVGFFDMAMPGGIDGAESIRRILELDNQILCAVVTAYTDRSTNQLGNLFARQDDWLYFNKPFTTGELEQTAYHLVTAWNQRRREEYLVSNLGMMQNSLIGILNTVSNINRIPPLVMEALVEGLLNHYLKLADANDGFIYLPQGKRFTVCGRGVFDGYEDFSNTELEPQWKLAKKVMDDNKHTIIETNMAATPLIVGSEVLGVLFVQTDETINHNPRLFDMYAAQAVNMIQHSNLYEERKLRNLELNKKNKELVYLIDKLTQSEQLQQQFKRLSFIDTLTGIPNRRYIEAKLEESVEQARLEGSYMACVMLDIDHFKQINDSYGHKGGDHVLKEIAKVFKLHKRSNDLIGRYGGEEFLMLYINVNPGDAMAFCERLRKSVEETSFRFGDQNINVTVSVGCTIFNPINGDSVDGIIEKADQALYMAKEGGRNRCVHLRAESVDDDADMDVTPVVFTR